MRWSRIRRFAIGALIVAGIVGLVLVLPFGGRVPQPVCLDDPASFPHSGVEGWRGEQLENAATIVRTATALGFGRDGQILGVMTAMGESSLRNIDYGDGETQGVTNPDGTRTTSIGLFQQQEWWGSVETRMDPAAAATLFYGRLAALDGWAEMDASEAIHRVQVNSDPDHYARYRQDAAAVVDALSGPCPA